LFLFFGMMLACFFGLLFLVCREAMLTNSLRTADCSQPRSEQGSDRRRGEWEVFPSNL
jgi:hypothetical protein